MVRITAKGHEEIPGGSRQRRGSKSSKFLLKKLTVAFFRLFPQEYRDTRYRHPSRRSRKRIEDEGPGMIGFFFARIQKAESFFPVKNLKGSIEQHGERALLPGSPEAENGIQLVSRICYPRRASIR